jgi:DNA invertase Pin-like site-specific DNA recombinase
MSLDAARAQRRLGTGGMLADLARARRDDPETSHAAAERVRRSGQVAAHQLLIRDAIQRRPGMTYVEIAEATGLERHAVGRRLKELEPVHAKRGAARNGMQTWWPVERST